MGPRTLKIQECEDPGDAGDSSPRCARQAEAGPPEGRAAVPNQSGCAPRGEARGCPARGRGCCGVRLGRTRRPAVLFCSRGAAGSHPRRGRRAARNAAAAERAESAPPTPREAGDRRLGPEAPRSRGRCLDSEGRERRQSPRSGHRRGPTQAEADGTSHPAEARRRRGGKQRSQPQGLHQPSPHHPAPLSSPREFALGGCVREAGADSPGSRPSEPARHEAPTALLRGE